MTPAKTVREQVEESTAFYGDPVTAGLVLRQHATLFAAAEETAAQLASLTKERDELLEAMEGLACVFGFFEIVTDNLDQQFKASEAAKQFHKALRAARRPEAT